MENKKIGSCIHAINDYICSHGVHQNYPCPYRCDMEKCSYFIAFTEQMQEDIKTKGGYRIIITPENEKKLFVSRRNFL